MRPHDRQLAAQIEQELQHLGRVQPLPGIATANTRAVLLEQVIDSIRRIRYVTTVATRDINPGCLNPLGPSFNPIKGAALCKRQGRVDEAFWLVFLAIHFGKSGKTGWRLCADVYGALGSGTPWTWDRISSELASFRPWLTANYSALAGQVPQHKFGNHRKFESFRPDSKKGLVPVIESYVAWVGPAHTHLTPLAAAQRVGNDPRLQFDYLYRSMNVFRFGRTAKFDYLTMLGKLGLAQIDAASTYMEDASGPAQGAKLLFTGNPNANVSTVQLDTWLAGLEANLSLGVQGMQVLEDALCNWQKSPVTYVRFR